MESWKYFCLIKRPQFQRDTQTEHLLCKPVSSSCPLKLRLAAVGILGSVCREHLGSFLRTGSLPIRASASDVWIRAATAPDTEERGRVRRGSRGEGREEKAHGAQVEMTLRQGQRFGGVGAPPTTEMFQMKIRTEPWRSEVTPKDTWVLKQISRGLGGKTQLWEVEGDFGILEILFKNTIVGYK